MDNHIGIVREEKELKEGIQKLEEIKAQLNNMKAHPASQYNPGWNLAIDLNNGRLTPHLHFSVDSIPISPISYLIKGIALYLFYGSKMSQTEINLFGFIQ